MNVHLNVDGDDNFVSVDLFSDTAHVIAIGTIPPCDDPDCENCSGGESRGEAIRVGVATDGGVLEIDLDPDTFVRLAAGMTNAASTKFGGRWLAALDEAQRLVETESPEGR
jgi:hypothetical protein